MNYDDNSVGCGDGGGGDDVGCGDGGSGGGGGVDDGGDGDEDDDVNDDDSVS